MNDYCVDLNIDINPFNTILPPMVFLKSRSQFSRHFRLDYETEISQEIKFFFVACYCQILFFLIDSR